MTKKSGTAAETNMKAIIARLNNAFSDVLPCKVPLDQPFIEHTAADQKEHGWLAWYLLPKDSDAPMDTAEYIGNDNAAVVGSNHAMGFLLSQEKWKLVRVEAGFSMAEYCYEIEPA